MKGRYDDASFPQNDGHKARRDFEITPLCRYYFIHFIFYFWLLLLISNFTFQKASII